jgi:hypothetical protein
METSVKDVDEKKTGGQPRLIHLVSEVISIEADIAKGRGTAFNVLDSYRDDPEGLLSLLQMAVPVYLGSESAARALALISQLMRDKPLASLMDLYRTLHSVPEFVAFANAMLHGFMPAGGRPGGDTRPRA